MKRRDRYVIYYQILSSLAEKPMSKTELSQRLNILYYSLIKYITNLEKKGLVRAEDTKYVVTEKGKEVMNELEPYVNVILAEKELQKKLDL